MSQTITGNVKIKFIDDSEMVITDADTYGYYSDSQLYYVLRYGYKIFFNPSQVKYIGREFDINNEPRRWK
jgi:hypothetical protein